MSSLDLDIDTQMTALELEWREAFEAGVLARADYESLRDKPGASAAGLQKAIRSLERAEAVKALVMRKIERLEDCLGGSHVR